MRSVLLSFSFTLFLFQCQSPKKEITSTTPPKIDSSSTAKDTSPDTNATDTVEKANTPVPSYQNPYLQYTSHYIAGLPIPPSSFLYAKTQDTVWQTFAVKIDTSWKQIEKNRLEPMRLWAKDELTERNDNQKPLFYPFSGPDFLNAFTFFPNTKTYYMFALENLGKMPEVSKLSKKQQDTLLRSVDASLSDIFKKSYFITKRMLQHLDQNRVNGVTPLICLFLVRTGHTLVDIQPISLSPEGQLVTYTRLDSVRKKKNRGVRIVFTQANDTVRREIVYFKVDLEDKALAANPSFMAFLNSKGTMNGYLKSASYLLHYRDFGTIRNLMLDKCDFILQDDSGIAYHFFDPKKWNIQLYGTYAKPVKDFSGVDQADLKTAYATDPTLKKLPFTLGYHWGSKEVNMMRAIKKGE